MLFPLHGRISTTAFSRDRLLWLAGVCAVLAVWLFSYWAFRGQPGDDPFITYRYASNVASGNGFVFNLGERVQSTTTPLLTLILAGAGLLGLDIPSFGYLFSQLCLLVFAVLCVRLVGLSLTPWHGLAVVGLTFASQVTTFGLGAEMPLLVALSWAAWLMAAREQWKAAAAFAALAAVTRGDGILVGVSLAAVYIWTHRKTSIKAWPWTALIIYVVLAAPWYLFAWFYFGSPLPATFGAKLVQGSEEGAATFGGGLWLFWGRALGDFSWLALPLLLILAVGFVSLVRSHRSLAPIWVWAVLFAGSFSLLHLPRYPWYYCPLVPVAALCLVLGGAQLGSLAARQLRSARPETIEPRFSAWAALAVTLLVGALYLLNDAQSARLVPSPRSQMYISAGGWIAANLPPGSLGGDEVGLLGYYSRRRIIDFVGLIQPDVGPHRAARDFLWVMKQYKPDYIFALPSWLAAFGPDPWVKGHYTTLRTFEGFGSENGQPLVGTLLRRNP